MTRFIIEQFQEFKPSLLFYVEKYKNADSRNLYEAVESEEECIKESGRKTQAALLIQATFRLELATKFSLCSEKALTIGTHFKLYSGCTGRGLAGGGSSWASWRCSDWRGGGGGGGTRRPASSGRRSASSSSWSGSRGGRRRWRGGSRRSPDCIPTRSTTISVVINSFT